MKDVFLVVWSGGYDAPQYELRGADVEAWALARTWREGMRQGEDTIDVLRIDLDAMTVERLDSHQAGVGALSSASSRAADDGYSILRGTHSTVRFPVSGSDQERAFANATLQSTTDLADSIEFSVAMRIEVDPRTVAHPVGAPAVERVAHALHGLFGWLASEVASSDGPIGSVSFEAEVGPFEDGDDFEEVPVQLPPPRRFEVSVPHDSRATLRLLERLGADSPVVRVAERPTARTHEAEAGR